MTEKLVLHEYSASGNCYKVRLTAAFLGQHLERREYDIMNGETRTAQFLEQVNANGRIKFALRQSSSRTHGEADLSVPSGQALRRLGIKKRDAHPGFGKMIGVRFVRVIE